jgi:hypothetical protein
MAAEPQEIAVSWGFVFSAVVFDSGERSYGVDEMLSPTQERICFGCRINVLRATCQCLR